MFKKLLKEETMSKSKKTILMVALLIIIILCVIYLMCSFLRKNKTQEIIPINGLTTPPTEQQRTKIIKDLKDQPVSAPITVKTRDQVVKELTKGFVKTNSISDSERRNIINSLLSN